MLDLLGGPGIINSHFLPPALFFVVHCVGAVSFRGKWFPTPQIQRSQSRGSAFLVYPVTTVAQILLSQDFPLLVQRPLPGPQNTMFTVILEAPAGPPPTLRSAATVAIMVRVAMPMPTSLLQTILILIISHNIIIGIGNPPFPTLISPVKVSTPFLHQRQRFPEGGIPSLRCLDRSPPLLID